jgi:hypothetical protein
MHLQTGKGRVFSFVPEKSEGFGFIWLLSSLDGRLSGMLLTDWLPEATAPET